MLFQRKEIQLIITSVSEYCDISGKSNANFSSTIHKINSLYQMRGHSLIYVMDLYRKLSSVFLVFAVHNPLPLKSWEL